MAGHLVKYGKHRTRRSYSRIKEVLDLPNLIEIQTDSYNWFMEKGLREMNLGPWDGKFISEIKREFPEEYEKRGTHLLSYKMGHGSENFFDLQYRVMKTLSRILKTDDSRDLILTAHSGVLRGIANNLVGKDISDPWEKMKNGEVRVIGG